MDIVEKTAQNKAESVYGLLVDQCPGLKLELTTRDGSTIILLATKNENAYTELRICVDKYFKDGSQENTSIVGNFSVIDMSAGFIAIRTSDNETIYLIDAEAYKADASYFHKVIDFEASLASSFETLADQRALRAFMGDYSFIIPMIAGLKPVGDVGIKNWRGKATMVTAEMVEMFNEYVSKGILAKIQVNSEYFLYYNPTAVTKIVLENADQFVQFGILASDSPEEIVTRVFRSGEGRNEKLVGLLYGFDRQSVLNFGGSADAPTEFPLNVWDVLYKVDQPHSNPNYVHLSLGYEALVKRITDGLQSGESPSNILSSICGLSIAPALLQKELGKQVESIGAAIQKNNISE